MAEGFISTNAQYCDPLLKGNSCQALDLSLGLFGFHLSEIPGLIGKPVYLAPLEGVEKFPGWA